MKLDPLPSGDMVDIHIRLPRSHRAEVHFHLEASEGLGYLEHGAAPDLGVVHVPPAFVDEVIDWIEGMNDTLEIDILKITY